jgi:imidazolonepropionase-like amidohydrolase
VLHNKLDNRAKFLGIGNYNEQGFACIEKALPLAADVLRRARKAHVKVVLGTDAWPARMAATPRSSSIGCRTGAIAPWMRY